MDTPLSISSSELQDLQESEACIIREFSLPSGGRISYLVATGTKAEMEEENGQRQLIKVPDGMAFECQHVFDCTKLFDDD